MNTSSTKRSAGCRWRRSLLGLALGAGLAAGAAVADPLQARGPATLATTEAGFCAGLLHGQMFQRTELFFGRNSTLGPVTEAQSQDFLDTVVTPLFPDGLTVIDAKGQFRASASAPPEKEDAKLLVLLYPFNKAQNDAVEEIRSRYKSAFAQQSVLRVDERSCVSF